MFYTVRTRNFNAYPRIHWKLLKAKKWDAVVYCDPNDHFDCKHLLETSSELLARLTLAYFKRFEAESGGQTYMDTNRRRF